MAGDEFPGTMETGDVLGVTFVGLEGSAGLFGDEGGSGSGQGTFNCCKRRAMPKPPRQAKSFTVFFAELPKAPLIHG